MREFVGRRSKYWVHWLAEKAKGTETPENNITYAEGLNNY